MAMGIYLMVIPLQLELDKPWGRWEKHFSLFILYLSFYIEIAGISVNDKSKMNNEK
jgi:hypothetical protein